MKRLSILAPVAACLLLSNCAQTAPPVPPSLELPRPVSDLRAERKGDKVTLRWTVPTQTMDGESLRDPGPTRICRSAESGKKICDVPLTEIAPVITPPEKAKAGVKTEGAFVDTLSANSLPSSIFLTYAVEVLNGDHRSAGPSNTVQVASVPTLPSPKDFKAEVSAEGIRLTWTPLTPPTDTNLPHQYRIYRRQEGNKGDVLAGEVPLDPPATQFLDHGFEWGKTYYYRLTVATEVPGGMHPCGTQARGSDCASVEHVEGDDTPIVKVFADDVFPPGVPSGLQAVFSGVGQKPFVDLLWSPSTDSDLAGYNIYRHEEGGQAVKLNSEPVKTPAYKDESVQTGKQYFYAVSAVDLRGNESERSEEANEQVP